MMFIGKTLVEKKDCFQEDLLKNYVEEEYGVCAALQ